MYELFALLIPKTYPDEIRLKLQYFIVLLILCNNCYKPFIIIMNKSLNSLSILYFLTKTTLT